MRRYRFPLALLLVILLAALLLWLWASDYVLISKCEDAGGSWNADARICEIPVNPAPTASAFPRT